MSLLDVLAWIAAQFRPVFVAAPRVTVDAPTGLTDWVTAVGTLAAAVATVFAVVIASKALTASRHAVTHAQGSVERADAALLASTRPILTLSDFVPSSTSEFQVFEITNAGPGVALDVRVTLRSSADGLGVWFENPVSVPVVAPGEKRRFRGERLQGTTASTHTTCLILCRDVQDRQHWTYRSGDAWATDPEAVRTEVCEGTLSLEARDFRSERESVRTADATP